MKKIKFTKMVASGNDFVVIDGRHQVTLPVPARLAGGRQAGTSSRHQALAKMICDRKFGIGADGLLLLEKSRRTNIKMRIFNADGSEAQMCGNGARCVALYAQNKILANRGRILIETMAGIIESEVNGNLIKIRLTDPRSVKLDLLVKLNRWLRVNFINTGVPHAVIFVEGLDKIDVPVLGRPIRFHKAFAPAGTNVDFVEIKDQKNISVRTYERGVEDETLACGTGSVAAAIISGGKIRNWQNAHYYLSVLTKSQETLQVFFDIINRKITNVWLQGRVRIVYQGVYYV